MKSPGNRAEFEKQLIANGIYVVFRQNDAGRIYGVTFIDHQNKCVINGSRLGKEFSANVFNELFTCLKRIMKVNNTNIPIVISYIQLSLI